jgi:hypothetical protein
MAAEAKEGMQMRTAMVTASTVRSPRRIDASFLLATDPISVVVVQPELIMERLTERCRHIGPSPVRSASSSRSIPSGIWTPSASCSRRGSSTMRRTWAGKAIRGRRWPGSLGRRARLQDDDRCLSRASCSVAVEVLVQFTPALPQLFTFLADRGPAEHLAPDPTC